MVCWIKYFKHIQVCPMRQTPEILLYYYGCIEAFLDRHMCEGNYQRVSQRSAYFFNYKTRCISAQFTKIE